MCTALVSEAQNDDVRNYIVRDSQMADGDRWPVRPRGYSLLRARVAAALINNSSAVVEMAAQYCTSRIVERWGGSICLKTESAVRPRQIDDFRWAQQGANSKIFVLLNYTQLATVF